MKKFILLALFAALALPQAAQSQTAEIIAGWDTWDDVAAPTVTVTATGITATATASIPSFAWSNTDTNGRGSSKDTTWGTFDGAGNLASAVTDVGVANLTATNGKTPAELTFTLTNNSGAAVDVNSFHMDVVAFRPNAARTYTLRVLSGDITAGDVFASAGTPMNDNSTNDITTLNGNLLSDDLDPLTHDQHEDLDIDMMGLADHTLADGESAVIQIEFTNGAGDGAGGHHLFLDNVAFSTAITETVDPVLLGDVDLSGEVNFLDIGPFIDVLSGGGFQAEADCDENEEVNFLDIGPFIDILSGS